jgi:hypothetical protein
MRPSGFLLYEHRHEPMLTRRQFLRRLIRHGWFAAIIVGISLLAGTFGYMAFVPLAPIDALLNAAMLLGGMGPVGAIEGTAGKLFATVFALYAGLVFVAVTGILLAPVFHRVLHHFHAESTTPRG